MTTVCIGCGLTTDDTGTLIIATSGSWPLKTDAHSSCCADTTRNTTNVTGPDTNGGLVYCSSDGKLRTYPRQHVLTTHDSVSTSYDATTGNVEDTHDTAPLSLVLTNPSPALPMCGWVSFAAFHEVTYLADADFTVTFLIDYGDGTFQPTEMRYVDGSGNGATKTDISRPYMTVDVCLDPGATKTIRLEVETHKTAGAAGPDVVKVVSSSREIRAFLVNI